MRGDYSGRGGLSHPDIGIRPAALQDPDVGLCALRDVLQPGGATRLMVYARYGRAGIYMMREYCRLLEVGASETDLQTLGAALKALPADHPISSLLRRSKDYWDNVTFPSLRPFVTAPSSGAPFMLDRPGLYAA